MNERASERGDAYCVNVSQSVIGSHHDLRPWRDQQPNQRHLDERFARLDLALVILTHLAVPGQPAKRAFHDPTFRKNGESPYPRLALHHLKVPIGPNLPVLCTSRSIIARDRPRQPRSS